MALLGPPDHFVARVMEALVKTGKSSQFVTRDLVDEVLHEMKWPYWKELTYFTRIDDFYVQCVVCGHRLERWAPYNREKSSSAHQTIHENQVRWILMGPEAAAKVMEEPSWVHTTFPTEIIERKKVT